MFSYGFKPSAVKELKKLPSDIQKRMIKKLDYFITTENPIIFADALVNSDLGTYRFRIGDHRVIFDVEGDVIVVLSVGHRRNIYR